MTTDCTEAGSGEEPEAVAAARRSGVPLGDSERFKGIWGNPAFRRCSEGSGGSPATDGDLHGEYVKAADAVRATPAYRTALSVSELSERIYDRLKETGMSAGELAVRLGVSGRRIGRLLGGSADDLTFGMVASMSSILGMDFTVRFRDGGVEMVEEISQNGGKTAAKDRFGENREGKMNIGFRKVHPDAKLPVYAHEGDAGMDVYAVEDVELKPGKATLVSTGLIADIPAGYEIQVRPRNGLALNRNITVWNSPGTVDSNYRGVVGVVMMYLPPVSGLHARGEEWVESVVAESTMVLKGERIAQLVVAPVTKCVPVEVTEVGETDRGTGGFGSTGA